MAFDLISFVTQLETSGVYDIVLPFLLVFAVVYGILTQMNIFHSSKGVNVVISLVIGLLAVNTRWGYGINEFYTAIAPRLGIGIFVILVILIMVGLFIPEDENRYWMVGLGVVGLITAIIILHTTFQDLGFIGYGSIGSDTVGWILIFIGAIGSIIAITAGSGQKSKPGAGFAKFTKLFE